MKDSLLRLEEEKVKSQEAESRAEEAERETSTLEKTLLEKTQVEEGKAALEAHIQMLSSTITNLEEELQTSTKNFQDLKEQVGTWCCICMTTLFLILNSLILDILYLSYNLTVMKCQKDFVIVASFQHGSSI